MNLDFEIETVIAIAICIAIIFCVKYGLNFYLKLKIFNEKKHFDDIFAKHLRHMPGSDFDIDKENAEKQK